jgi:hypothetical protein
VRVESLRMRIEPLVSRARSGVGQVARGAEARVRERARDWGKHSAKTTADAEWKSDGVGRQSPIPEEQEDGAARYAGRETLFGGGTEALSAGILDFWRWAYSDLTDNVNRGVFAEWMVGRLLGMDFTATRVPWDSCDLITPEGIRVEVKATAYVHVWTQHATAPTAKRNTARFTGLCGRAWTDASQTQTADEATFNADVYVFCLQANRDPMTWDALNLDQWEFYVLSRSRVERNGCQSMAISILRNLTTVVSAAGLREAVLAAHAEQGDT